MDNKDRTPLTDLFTSLFSNRADKDTSDPIDSYMTSYKEKLRMDYEKTLDAEAASEPSENEIQLMYTRFSTYATLQLLKIFSVMNHKEESNRFLNEFVNIFINEMKQGMTVKMEISDLVDEPNEVAQTFGKEIADKEKLIIKNRLTKLLDTFEKDIKLTLGIHE